MSATNTSGGLPGPLLVVDIHELRDHLRELEGESQDQSGGYSESFSWKKTDFAAQAGGAVAGSRQILGGDVRSVGGWSVIETTGAAVARINLREGNSAAGEVIVPIGLAIGASRIDWPTGRGIRVFTGRVFLEVVSGSVAGVLYWR